jgi:hypothetical protein
MVRWNLARSWSICNFDYARFHLAMFYDTNLMQAGHKTAFMLPYFWVCGSLFYNSQSYTFRYCLGAAVYLELEKDSRYVMVNGFCGNK